MNKMNNDTGVSASNLIYGYYIKKQRLQTIVFSSLNTLQNMNAKKLNIFIDINDIVKSIMYSNCFVPSNYEIACAIINMVAHYKSFFDKGGYGVEMEFFLLDSIDTYCNPSTIKRNPDYCSDIRGVIYNPYNSGKLNILSQNLGMVEMILQYIENVHYIKTKEEFSVAAYNYAIRFSGDDIANIVITKDDMAKQLASLGNIIIFRPKKIRTGNPENPSEDVSYTVNTTLSILYSLPNNTYVPDTLNRARRMSPAYWSVFFSLFGIKSRNIPSVCNIRKAIDIINTNSIILGGTITSATMNNLNLLGLDEHTIRPIICRNFDSISIYHKYSIYSMDPEASAPLPPTLFDNKSLQEINDKFLNSSGLFIDLITLLS